MAADTSLPDRYRDMAVLRRVLLAHDAPAAERRAALEPLTRPGQPYRALALEQQAMIALETGARDEALAILRALVNDQDATAGLRQRVGQLIVVLDGNARAG